MKKFFAILIVFFMALGVQAQRTVILMILLTIPALIKIPLRFQ